MAWQKSSKCKTDTPMCVEVEFSNIVKVRDSKAAGTSLEPNNTLFFSRDEWDDFIGAVKRGEFDIRD